MDLDARRRQRGADLPRSVESRERVKGADGCAVASRSQVTPRARVGVAMRLVRESESGDGLCASQSQGTGRAQLRLAMRSDSRYAVYETYSASCSPAFHFC